MLLVLDEWLLYDLRGDNGAQRQEQAEKLLKALIERCDGLVVPKGPWLDKAYDLAGFQDALRRGLSRLLQGILWDLRAVPAIIPAS